jgi:hypothetical protein
LKSGTATRSPTSHMRENIIHIGSDAEYKEVYCRGAFATYRKTSRTRISFINAKIPGAVRAGDPPAIPTSVLQEFGSETEATTALNRWADAPGDVPLLKKLDEPGSKKTVSSGSHKKRLVGPGQLDFQFS